MTFKDIKKWREKSGFVAPAAIFLAGVMSFALSACATAETDGGVNAVSTGAEPAFPKCSMTVLPSMEVNINALRMAGLIAI